MQKKQREVVDIIWWIQAWLDWLSWAVFTLNLIIVILWTNKTCEIHCQNCSHEVVHCANPRRNKFNLIMIETTPRRPSRKMLQWGFHKTSVGSNKDWWRDTTAMLPTMGRKQKNWENIAAKLQDNGFTICKCRKNEWKNKKRTTKIIEPCQREASFL